jgi:hypothetical protein
VLRLNPLTEVPALILMIPYNCCLIITVLQVSKRNTSVDCWATTVMIIMNMEARDRTIVHHRRRQHGGSWMSRISQIAVPRGSNFRASSWRTMACQAHQLQACNYPLGFHWSPCRSQSRLSSTCQAICATLLLALACRCLATRSTPHKAKVEVVRLLPPLPSTSSSL